jgi:hypothetical protein
MAVPVEQHPPLAVPLHGMGETLGVAADRDQLAGS